jgi:hypothetical protein
MLCASSPTTVKPLPLGTKAFEDRGLQRVGVLVFVHEHRIEPLPHECRQRLVLHEVKPPEQQVVVIEHRLLCLRATYARNSDLSCSG